MEAIGTKLLGDMFILKEVVRDGADKKMIVGLNPEHMIFKAHFPGYPITPGVCTMQLVQEALEFMTGRNLMLEYAKSVKFLNPLTPEIKEDVLIGFDMITETESSLSAKVTVMQSSSVIAKMSLLYRKP